MDELLREFIAETNEHLAVLDAISSRWSARLKMARLVDDIFRNVPQYQRHLQLSRAEAAREPAACRRERARKLRDETLPTASTVTAMLLGAGDRAKTIVAALAQDGHEPEGGDADIVARLELAMRLALAPAGSRVPLDTGYDRADGDIRSASISTRSTG